MSTSSPAQPPQPGQPIDRWLHAQIATLTGGISPAALRLAFGDWLTHLSHDPDEQQELTRKAAEGLHQLISFTLNASQSACKPCIEPVVQDPRFSHPAWQTWPYNAISQSFLLTQQWWEDAATGVRGVSHHHRDVVAFTIRQLLDIVSPANFLWTNPEVLECTARSGGANLVLGYKNLLEDLQRKSAKAAPVGAEAFQVGRDVAVTKGEVVYRNHLIELIQYAPMTGKVRPEPVLVVPSWIMKYYILDLSPSNSLIKYLVEQGFTVFAISWRNPGAEDRDLGLEDYLRRGLMDALDAVCTIVPQRRVHAAGYCLGGTLLAMAAAAMGRDGDHRLATVTMMAGQTDFTEPGELDLFIDESQIAFLEDIMWDKGYLDSSQMAGAFQLLSSSDLIWSKMLKHYLLGERSPVSDLMSWNADGTRLPYRMHTEYLRQLFLQNDLASGRFPVNGRPVALSDIQCPIYSVGTKRDHVAPWRSVYKIQLLTDVESTFLLSSGGHNVGIVNPPGVPGRSYQVLTRQHGDKYLDPDTWLKEAPVAEGSWWPHWAGWLQSRSGKPVTAPSMGNASRGLPALCAAPGTYVHQK